MLMSLPIVFEHHFEPIAVSSRSDEEMHRVIHESHCPRVPVGVHDVVIWHPVSVRRGDDANGRRINVHRRQNVATRPFM